MTVDSTKLDQALGGQIEGVALSDIQRLFTLDGQTDNANVRFLLGGIRTKETTTGYQIDVTQAAEAGAITATNALAASTVIDGTNDNLTIKVDGKLSSTITLAAGTYTRQQLASQLESAINANNDLPGRSVSISVQNDRLQITSDTYGLSSEVTIGSGTALTALGLTGSETDKGQDVVGKFVVDGVDEVTIGSGRVLIGDSKNANTADLQVQVTLTNAQLQAGTDANVTVTRGLASRLDQILNSFLDPVDGRVKITNNSFDDRVENLEESIAIQNENFEIQRETLLGEFIALETAVSELKTTGNFLSTQLIGLQQSGSSQSRSL